MSYTFENDDIETMIKKSVLRCMKYSSDSRHRTKSSVVDDIKAYGMRTFISGAFTWSKTPEGHIYWRAFRDSLPREK